MLDIDALYKECTSSVVKPIITARMVYDCIISPFKVWCEFHAPQDEKDQLSNYMKFLFEQGQLHEERTVEAAYPDAQKLTFETPEEGFQLVLKAMSEGVSAIHNAPIFLMGEGLTGRIDILERNDDHSSIFGDYHYIIKEIKMAKNIKEYHCFQASFYNYIVGKIQGHTSNYYIIVNRDRDEASYPYSEDALMKLLKEIREIYNGKEVLPTYGACDWPWETFNNKEAIKRKDISLVSGIGPSFREKLVNVGFNTFPKLVKAKTSDLTKIRGIGEKRANKFLTNASSLLKGTHQKLDNVTFPPVTTEIFLDLEGTGEQISDEEIISLDYLIGVLVRKNGKEKYMPFLSSDLESEDRMFREFLDWLDMQEDYLIFHWHHYEKTHLSRLAERHGIEEKMEDKLFGRLRDLYKDATKCFAFPTYGSGLKEVANYIGFSWRDEEINAMESAVLYFQYVQDPERYREELDKVLGYNEDDCIATMRIKDWIYEQCQ